MLAEIITIGDEILIGQIVDTNSAWIAQKLNQSGIRVKQITSVSDDREHILEALTTASKRATIVIITGGLGPTKDDITKTTLTEYFKVGIKRDEATLQNVTKIFARYKRPLLEVNIRQADVPENCKVLLNTNGTAPGMWFDEAGVVYVSMPGVPFEMMYLVEEEVLPRLKKRFNLDSIVHRTILTAGIGESFLAETIADIEESLPVHLKLAYLPKLSQVRLRLSAYGGDELQLNAEIQLYMSKIVDKLGEFVVATEDITIEKAILDYMGERNLTLSVAESCTGGYLSHIFTQHPGSSTVFLGGAVTYSNDLKVKILDVSEQIILQYGAVSEETVKEMACGALSKFNSDYAIAISGIAGPDGGTPDKPLGTVWISVAGKKKIVAKKFQFGSRRLQNIERASVSALTLLFHILKEEHTYC
ncbi:MAG: competence/damage-inducible protein A [Pyrinomonadaceae bacterium]|nr:competence/damage-inducible protein A [Sphingobacteriaceae bacterium]